MRIRVQDTGEGLSPEQLTQLFQPFNRLGQEASDEEGTGIGLVVSKRLVELMGGEIGVESSVGVWAACSGSKLNLAPALKPAAGADATACAGASARPARRSAAHPAVCGRQSGKHEAGRTTYWRGRPDLRLLGAENGTRGIALARIHRPQVILMDINLPGISGIQALKILREDPVTAHIPVLAISANAMPLDIRKGLEAGFFRYLTKPIRVNEFMDAVDMALEFAQTGAGGAINLESR